MRFEKIYDVLIQEMFDYKIKYNPNYSINQDKKSNVFQEFDIQNKKYRVSADLLDIGLFKNILHVEFAKLENDGSEIFNLTKDNSGYIGNIYGIILNWVDSMLKDNKFKYVEHIIVIGENDDGNTVKGNFYNKLANRFIKIHSDYIINNELAYTMYKKLSKEQYTIISVSKK